MPVLRQGREEDLDSLTALLRILFTLEEDFTFVEARQRRGLLLMLNNQCGCVLVAEESGKVIGMCTGQMVISTAEGGPAVLVEDMVIDPDHRAKGLGRALIEALTDWAHQKGATRLQLLADKNNIPALAFYQHLGWENTALVCLRQNN